MPMHAVLCMPMHGMELLLWQMALARWRAVCECSTAPQNPARPIPARHAGQPLSLSAD